jgi:hypothetical protein
MKTGLEVNTEKIKHMLNGNAGENHDVQIANKSFKNVANSEYLGTITIKIILTKIFRADSI